MQILFILHVTLQYLIYYTYLEIEVVIIIIVYHW